jgi:hypothetical protein
MPFSRNPTGTHSRRHPAHFVSALYNRKGNLLWALSFGYPITRQWGVKTAYIGTRTSEPTGVDSDTIDFALSTFW